MSDPETVYRTAGLYFSKLLASSKKERKTLADASREEM